MFKKPWGLSPIHLFHEPITVNALEPQGSQSLNHIPHFIVYTLLISEITRSQAVEDVTDTFTF